MSDEGWRDPGEDLDMLLAAIVRIQGKMREECDVLANHYHHYEAGKLARLQADLDALQRMHETLAQEVDDA